MTKKKLFVSLMVSALVLSTYSQNTISKQTEDRVEQVGNKVWFIKNFQKDSLLCASDVTGLCQLKTSWYQEVDVVETYPDIPINRIIDAYRSQQDVPWTQQEVNRKKIHSWTGFTHDQVITYFTTYVRIDSINHKAVSIGKTETQVVHEKKWSIVLMFVLLVVCITIRKPFANFFDYALFIVMFSLLGAVFIYSLLFYQLVTMSFIQSVGIGIAVGITLLVMVHFIEIKWFSFSQYRFSVEKKMRITSLVSKFLQGVLIALFIGSVTIQSSYVYAIRLTGILAGIWALFFFIITAVKKMVETRKKAGIVSQGEFSS